jgi:hypothetical protein
MNKLLYIDILLNALIDDISKFIQIKYNSIFHNNH